MRLCDDNDACGVVGEWGLDDVGLDEVVTVDDVIVTVDVILGSTIAVRAGACELELARDILVRCEDDVSGLVT